MENIPDQVPVIALAVILVLGWILLRFALKLTATLFRIGCFIIFLIAAGGLVISFLN